MDDISYPVRPTSLQLPPTVVTRVSVPHAHVMCILVSIDYARSSLVRHGQCTEQQCRFKHALGRTASRCISHVSSKKVCVLYDAWAQANCLCRQVCTSDDDEDDECIIAKLRWSAFESSNSRGGGVSRSVPASPTVFGAQVRVRAHASGQHADMCVACWRARAHTTSARHGIAEHQPLSVASHVGRIG
jgi:hypothetical protein